MIIWPASTHRANWTTHPTPGWHYACSETGYTNSRISLEWLKLVFDPQTKERANKKPRVLIWDGFGSHQTLEVLEFCFENNIIPCRMPSHTSHKLQPCDIAVFDPLKAAYREQVERLERSGVASSTSPTCTALQGKELSPKETSSQDGKLAVCIHMIPTKYLAILQNQLPNQPSPFLRYLRWVLFRKVKYFRRRRHQKPLHRYMT